LSAAVYFQSVKSVTGKNFQVIKAYGQFNEFKPENRSGYYIRRQTLRFAGAIELLRVFVGECPDHSGTVICHVTCDKLCFPRFSKKVLLISFC